MPKTILTDENIKFIKANRLKMSGSDIAKVFVVSKSCINRYMRKNGLSVQQALKNKFKADANTGRTTFSKNEDEFIKKNYLLLPIKRIAHELNRSFTGVTGRLKFFNLEVPPDLAVQRRQIGMYRKGQLAINKGKKQGEYMSAEAIEKTKATRFKKGLRPHNSLPVGTIVKKKERFSEKVYKYEVQPAGKMLLYQRIIWERTKGKIPLGHCLWFLDGNSLNCSIENLELITRAENMKRNTICHYPIELKETIILKNKINKKLYEQRKSTSVKQINN
jgi:hypothetical protein